MRDALRRIVAFALLPVALAISITAAKRAHSNPSAMLKKIAAVYKDERNAHNNYLINASGQGWYKIEALSRFAVRAENAISRLP